MLVWLPALIEEGYFVGLCVLLGFFLVLGSNLYHCCHYKMSVVSHWLALDFLKSFVELGCCSLYISPIYCTFYLFASSH